MSVYVYVSVVVVTRLLSWKWRSDQGNGPNGARGICDVERKGVFTPSSAAKAAPCPAQGCGLGRVRIDVVGCATVRSQERETDTGIVVWLAETSEGLCRGSHMSTCVTRKESLELAVCMIC